MERNLHFNAKLSSAAGVSGAGGAPPGGGVPTVLANF